MRGMIMAKQRASLKGRGLEIQGLAKGSADAAAQPTPMSVGTALPPAPGPDELRSAPEAALLTPDIEAALAFEADASEASASDLFMEIPVGLRSVPAMPPREAQTPATRGAPALDADDALAIPGDEIALDESALDESALDEIEAPPDAPLNPGEMSPDVSLDQVETPPGAPLIEALPAARISPTMPPVAVAAPMPPAAAVPPTLPAQPRTEAPPAAARPDKPAPSAQPTPKPPSEDKLMDDLLPAVPGVADDALTEDILAAMPPTVGSPPPTGDAVEPITTVRSPLPPYSGAPATPPSVGLAPVVTEPATPALQPPGGPAPARLRVGGLVLEGPLTGEVIPPGPGVQAGDDKTLTIRDLTDEQARRILGRVTPEQLRALSRDIDRLYDRATQDLANDALRGEKALELLHQSRMILLEKPENYVDAEYQVQRVQAMLVAANNSRQWATELGPRLFRYEAVWMFGLLLAFILSNGFWPRISAWLMTVVGVPATSVVISQAMPFLSTLFWGGLGGTIGALWSLWYHISERRDFDREYNIWYLTQPIMGMVLGGLVYLLFATGLLVLQAGTQTTSESLGARLLPSLIAAIGGFRQNFVYEQMGRIVELFSGRQGQNEPPNNTAGGGA